MSFSRNHSPTYSVSVAALALSVLASCGCAGLRVPQLTLPRSPFKLPSSPTYQGIEPGFELRPELGEQVYQSVREAAARNAVVLQVVGDSTPIRVLPLPTDGRSVTVSQLLTQTGVSKKLGSLQATLFRPAADSIAGLPLQIHVADDGVTIRPESDYALRAGDRVRVGKSARPVLKTMLESVLML